MGDAVAFADLGQCDIRHVEPWCEERQWLVPNKVIALWTSEMPFYADFRKELAKLLAPDFIQDHGDDAIEVPFYAMAPYTQHGPTH